MRPTELLKKLVRDYLIIFSAIMICLTLLRTFFAPDSVITVTDIYVLMICALAGDLPGLILYSPKALSEKKMRLRVVLHFLILEVVILTLAAVAGWVSGWVNITVLAVQIALIYAFVRLLVWIDDRKITDSINARLKAINAIDASPEQEPEK